MSFGSPGLTSQGSSGANSPVYGYFDAQAGNNPNTLAASSSSSRVTTPTSWSSSGTQTPEGLENAQPLSPIPFNHTLVQYSIYNFEGGPLNLPPLPQAVKEQILFASASYKDASDLVHIHQNFGFSHLSPFEIVILYRVINSYHKFWESTYSPNQPIFHRHLQLIEDYLGELAWENPEKANQVALQIQFMQDSNLQELLVKIGCELSIIRDYSRIEHAKLLTQHAILFFNYDNAETQPRLLSEAVKRQVRLASCCYRNIGGEVVFHKNFKYDHLSAQDVAMLYRVLHSYYRKWDSVQNGPNAIFDRHLAGIEKYLDDLCWSNPQKARNIRAALDLSGDLNLQEIVRKLDENLVKLNGYTLVPHAALLSEHVRWNFPNLSEPVQKQIGFAMMCYRNAEGEILVHKNFKFDHLTPEEFAVLFRVLNSYYITFDRVSHNNEAVFHKHLSMMEEYLEGLCWNNPQRVEQIRDALLLYGDPNLHGIIQKQTSYLLNLLPYSLIEHASKWFNYDGSNVHFSQVYQPLTEPVKEQIRFALLTDHHVNGTKEIHKNFHLDHLSIEEVAQLYAVIHSYYESFDHLANKEVYQGHVTLIQKHMEDLSWRNPQLGPGICVALNRFNSTGSMTGLIQKIAGIGERLRDAVLVPHAGSLLTHAENVFNYNGNIPDQRTLSDAVKKQLGFATICYRTEGGELLIHSQFMPSHLSPEDLAALYAIINSFYLVEEKGQHGGDAVFPHHLQAIESNLEKTCRNDLQRVTTVRNALVHLADPKLHLIIRKLTSYIENLSGTWNLISYAGSWFNFNATSVWYPLLSESLKEQIWNSVLFDRNEDGSICLHKDFTVNELSPYDLAILYRLFNSYYVFHDNIAHLGNAPFGRHLELTENYIVDLAWHDLEKAILVKSYLTNMGDPNLKRIIGSLDSHLLLQPDTELGAWEPKHDGSFFQQVGLRANAAPDFSGTSAFVNLYPPHASISAIAPNGVAVKTYYKGFGNDRMILGYFAIELDYLKRMQGYPGVPILIDYSEADRTIMMTALRESNGLDLIKEDPERMEDLCNQHMLALARLHKHTNKAFSIPRTLVNRNQESIEEVLRKLDMNCISTFREILALCPNANIKAQVGTSFDRFLQTRASEKSSIARCLNDSCIDSYFPASDMFIDFNASGTSPVERDIAAAIVNLLIKMLNNGIIIQPDRKREILVRMVNTYLQEYIKSNEGFVLDLNHLRLFFAQQLLIYCNACLQDRNVLDYFKTALPERVLGLLDTNRQFTLEEMVDFVMTGLAV